MGDYYEFDIRTINGKEVRGFCYCNAATGWSEIFVQFDEGQADKVNEIQAKFEALHEDQCALIKSWIN